MNIFIIGGTEVIYYLAKSLISKGHQLTIINDNREYCNRLSRDLEATVIFGDGTKSYVLEDSEMEVADIVIANMLQDSDGLVACELAKKMFGIKKRVAVVNNPQNIELFKKMGIEVVLSTTLFISKIMEQFAVTDTIKNIMTIYGENIIMTEVVIDKGYHIIGKKILELDFPGEAIISCIIRKGKIIIPKGDTKIQEEDRMMLLMEISDQSKIIEYICEE